MEQKTCIMLNECFTWFVMMCVKGSVGMKCAGLECHGGKVWLVRAGRTFWQLRTHLLDGDKRVGIIFGKCFTGRSED